MTPLNLQLPLLQCGAFQTKTCWNFLSKCLLGGICHCFTDPLATLIIQSIRSTPIYLLFMIFLRCRFWVNHHLLDIFQRPLWRVVKGRSQAYVAKVVSELKDVRTSTGVTSVVRLSGQSEDAPAVRVTDDAGGQDLFHQVVLATHRWELSKFFAH